MQPSQQRIQALLARTKAKEQERESARHIMDDEINKVDQLPWMRATNWMKMFIGRDMEALVKGCEKPTNDVFLSQIWKATMNLVEGRCMKGIIDCHERGWQWKALLQWLQSADSKSASATPFSRYIDQGTVHRYASLWAGLIVLCVRSFEERDIYDVPLSEKQMKLLNEVKTKWRERIEDDGLGWMENDVLWTDEIMEDLVLEFSRSVIMYEDWESVGVIPFYCGVLGYKVQTGTWSSAMEYTPILSAIQFCMRVIVFESSLPTDERHEFNNESESTPLQLFLPIRDRWLVGANATPFNYVHSLLNYGLVVSKSSLGTDHISFSHDNQVLYYDGVPLYLTKWIECLHKEIEELERLTRQLLHTFELPTVDFYSITDHHSMTDKDRYFGTELPGGPQAARERMIAQLETKAEMEMWLDRDGQEEFHKETVLRYERLVNEWLRVASVVIIKTCGLAGRGFEMLSIRYRNHVSSLRNILIYDGQMMIVTVYHKSMGIMDETKVLSD